MTDVKKFYQIWPRGEEMCVRARYCFEDVQVCPRKQCLEAKKLSLYHQAKITEINYWCAKFPAAWQWLSFMPMLQSEGGKKHLEIERKAIYFLLEKYSLPHRLLRHWKQTKQCKEDVKKYRERSMRSNAQALHSRKNIQTEGFSWRQPCKNTRAGCNRNRAGCNRNVPGSVFCLQSYCTQ